MGPGTFDNRCNECCTSRVFMVRSTLGIWLDFTLGKVLSFVLTPGKFNHFFCYTVLSVGPKDFKVGPLIHLGSL
jgi:hypothetical protein